MSNERRTVPLDEALRRIGDGEVVHTYRDAGVALIGADWPREHLVETIHKYGVEDSGPGASNMGHTLVLFDDRGPLFIAAAAPESAAQP